jgi:hypothetical protein
MEICRNCGCFSLLKANKQQCVHLFQYLLHYLKSLEGWFPKEEWDKVPLAKASFAFLQVKVTETNSQYKGSTEPTS